MIKENELIIKQLNKYGRVPKRHELLQMIEQLQQENEKLQQEVNYLSKEVGRWNSYYDDEFNENLKLKKKLEKLNKEMKNK